MSRYKKCLSSNWTVFGFWTFLYLIMQKISAIRPGESKRKLDSIVDAATKLNNNIMRLTLSDSSGKINLILEGTSLVRENKNVSPGSKVSLKNFTVTNSIDPIRKHFPRLIDPV